MSYTVYNLKEYNSLETGFFDGNGATNGNITGENAEKMAAFYKYWSSYLDATPAFLSFLAYLPGGIAKALYQITASLEHVFNNMFKLFGLFGYLGDSNTVIGQFYYWFQVLGTTIFTLILVVSALMGVFTKPVKFKGVITNFLLVSFVTAVLPFGLTTISSSLAQDAMNIQTVTSGDSDDSKHYSSLAIQPMKNNVVDLKVLIDNDFSTELFPLDSYGYIKPPKEGSTPVNNITDSPDKRDTSDFATRIDFGATYGASNSDLLDEMEEEQKGLKGLFLHRLNASQNGVETITDHKIVGEMNALEPVYMRYTVNWLGLFLQYGILIVLLISMSIKFVKSVFDIVIQAMISPIQGYSSLSSSKKYKELLRTMGGALAGIFFEIIIMRMTLEILRDLPTLSVTTVTKLSGGFFDGLNMWEQCLAACIIYVGIFFAAMQGVSMIERWLGVSTGHSETAQQLIGAMMAGQAFATGAGALGEMAFAGGGAAMNVAKKVPGVAAEGSKVLGNSLAATGGGIRGVWGAARDQGIKNTAKGGLSNMIDVADVLGKEAVGKAKDFAGGVADSLGQKEQAGYEAGYNAFKDNSLKDSPQSILNTPSKDFNEAMGFEPSLNSGGGETGASVDFPDSSGEGPSGVTESSLDSGPTGGPSLEVGQPDHFNAEPNLEPTTTNSSSPDLGQAAGRGTKPSLNRSQSKPSDLQPNLTNQVNRTEKPSSKDRFKNSVNQMYFANQQAQNGLQRMQNPSHIKGAEIEDGDE
ncbi:pLS20_p028 family conjugation system transmembrane protein [Streptococcus sp. 10F2]